MRKAEGGSGKQRKGGGKAAESRKGGGRPERQREGSGKAAEGFRKAKEGKRVSPYIFSQVGKSLAST